MNKQIKQTNYNYISFSAIVNTFIYTGGIEVLILIVYHNIGPKNETRF